MNLTSDQISILKLAFKPLELSVEKHPLFFEQWQEDSFERYEFITEAGKIERYFYIIESGVQIIYILDHSGNKRVLGFSFDGSYSGVYDSFLDQKPSSYFIESLTPSKVLKIDKSQYNSFFENYPEFEHWGRIIHAKLFVGRVEREIELITLTAKERFEVFSKRCPEPLKNIPQKYLASYLNMTPETYSRLRAEL
ncbi:MAG: Crp/Fnr family transcriptional regulator [Crocinitomicaceae bacterium]|nr:Crp/Fnr family transcriptional regulator [Crocinitomicaceae bacterium]